ncbi:MAG: C25 family cysteine peptidase [Candidatus Hermodarchaeota archaeon]
MIIRKSKLLLLILFLVSCTTHFNINNTTNQLNINSSYSINISATNTDVNYLIITSDDFVNILESLAQWKTQKGVISKIEVISDIEQQYSGGTLPEKIKNCINDYYNNNNTQWVLLAGDQDHVPTKYIVCDDGYIYDGDVVSCDSYYGDMDNDWSQEEFDYEVEVYIGRLTANSRAEMQNLVQRILNYEKNPPVGDWMTNALFAGAILQYNIDWDYDNKVDFGECDANRLHHFINTTLIPDNWTSTFLAQTQGIKGSNYSCDAELGYSNLKNAINEGCSVGTIIAHGRPERISVSEWVTDFDGDLLFDYTADPFFGGGTAIDEMTWEILFETTTADLKEADKLGIYYFGSCSVGTFDYTQDCVAEYFLKKAAIGCVAGSYVVWGEDQWYERAHGGWFVDGLGYRFWEQLFHYNQPGKALALAKADYASDRISSSEPKEYSEWGNKTLKQFNLLGDPEVPIWLSIPKRLNVSVDQPFDNNTNTMTLLVTAEGSPVNETTVTYTENNELIWIGETHENGTIKVPFSQIEIDNLVFTASKKGFLPYQANLPESGSPGIIAGYEVCIISLTILGFIGIISVYYRQSLIKKEQNN